MQSLLIIEKGVVRRLGELVTNAERNIIEKYHTKWIATENNITDRFFERLEIIFEQESQEGDIIFKSKTFKDKGEGASEKIFGSDVLGILNVDLVNYSVTKGFLAQAKVTGRGISVIRKNPQKIEVKFERKSVLDDLKKQCHDMLTVSPDSFVLVYSPDGFTVVPATSVSALASPGSLFGKRISSFFMEYLMCFIGDHRLNAHDDASLERLRLERDARTAMLLEVTERSRIDANR